MADLTDRQREILEIIVDHMNVNGRSPTIREIMVASGIKSPNGVMCHVRSLAKKGYVVCTGNVSRNIRLNPAKVQTRNEKLLSRAQWLIDQLSCLAVESHPALYAQAKEWLEEAR